MQSLLKKPSERRLRTSSTTNNETFSESSLPPSAPTDSSTSAPPSVSSLSNKELMEILVQEIRDGKNSNQLEYFDSNNC